jgi:hypothetical protein
MKNIAPCINIELSCIEGLENDRVLVPKLTQYSGKLAHAAEVSAIHI